MFQSLEQLAKANTTIYQTPVLILASVICGRLENAGIPVVLGQNRDAYTVNVPHEYVPEATALL